MAKAQRNRFNKDHLTLGVVFVCIALLIGVTQLLPPVPTPAPAAEVIPVTQAGYSSTTTALPARLQIPRINLDTTFGPTLGLRQNGEVEVPTSFEQVGWYQYSPLPGTLGPAVVLGHVDSYQGPAVLYSIGQLRVGDEIFITNASGTVHTFVVEASEKYEQAAFPTALVYGDLDYAGLRIITCSGWYDKTAQRYSHNRVVFARLVK